MGVGRLAWRAGRALLSPFVLAGRTRSLAPPGRYVPFLVPCVLAACADDRGVVEVNWVVVDRDGEPLFPGGALSVGARQSTCGFGGDGPDGRVTVDLRVELEICDPACEAGCDDPSCQVVEPLRFPCTSARGSNRDIPASDDPYRFLLRARLVAPSAGIDCASPDPTCVAVPGARDRTVAAGLVTDLQVYQIVVDLRDGVDESFDLGACGCA
jgi:hypothetical protein